MLLTRCTSRSGARQSLRGRLQPRAQASPIPTQPERAASDKKGSLKKTPFKAILFDMDGTLTVSNIDFKLMRQRTNIIEGDLFTIMEEWNDPPRIKESMDIILDMEADALKTLQLQPGLEALLQQIVDDGAHLGVVTRNTPKAVNAFFSLLGGSWRDRFSQVLTREFKYVKPDRRLLLHVAQNWGIHPSEMLMVGDSKEDVEVGALVGASTCLITGGGNEPFASCDSPDAICPTFTVSSMAELAERLRSPEAAVAVEKAHALPPGVAFIDELVSCGSLGVSDCSYPRMGSAAGGLQSGPLGTRALHLGCGDCTLTRAMHSQGVRVTAADTDAALVSAATKRGLPSLVLPASLSVGCLGTDQANAFQTVFSHSFIGGVPLYLGQGSSGFSKSALELYRVVASGGMFAGEFGSEGVAAGIFKQQMVALASALQTAGFTQVELRDGAPAGPQFVSSRIVAKKF